MERVKTLARNEWVPILKIVIGCFLYALSVVLFIDPVNIIPGSVTGIAVVVKALTGFPIGLFSIIVNVPLVIWGTVKLGKRLLVYTGLTVLLSSVMIDALAFLPPMTTDLLLASVFGAVVMGVGLGLILDAGGTTGGTTVIGRLVVKRYPHIPIGNILLIGDFIIITIGSLLLQDWNLMLYSVIDLYVCVVVIDKVMYGYKIKSYIIVFTKAKAALLQRLEGRKACQILESGEGSVIMITKKKDVSDIQHIAEEVDADASCATFDIDYSFGNLFGSHEWPSELDPSLLDVPSPSAGFDDRMVRTTSAPESA